MSKRQGESDKHMGPSIKVKEKDIVSFEIYATDPKGEGDLSPMSKACAAADMRAVRVKQLLEDYFNEAVQGRLEIMEIDTMIEMQAEAAIERAIQHAVAHGWSDNHSIEKCVHAKVREMVSARVEAEYTVEVDVRLVRKETNQ